MSILTLAYAATGNNGPNSYNQGYTDGEFAALEKLPSRRVHARAEMGADHDPLWAQGYIDGYLHQIAVTHALNEKQEPRR